MVVHSNIVGGQHGYLGLVVRSTTYDLLASIPFVRPAHSGNLSITIESTLHAQ